MYCYLRALGQDLMTGVHNSNGVACQSNIVSCHTAFRQLLVL